MKVTGKVGEKEKEEVRVKENGKAGFLVAVISVQCVSIDIWSRNNSIIKSLRIIFGYGNNLRL